MKTKTVNLYTFDELSEDAKEKARQWWRELEAGDFDAESVIDDAARMAEILGITFATRSVKRMDGGFNEHPKVWFSGFSSQGDGASFEGSYEYRKGALKTLQKEAPASWKDPQTGEIQESKGNKELHRIARELQEIQRKNFYQITASISQSGRYYHSGTMSVSISRENWVEPTEGADEEVAQLMKDFADWIYSQLESEYDYRMSDENVDESIRINEYTFTEDGERED